MKCPNCSAKKPRVIKAKIENGKAVKTFCCTQCENKWEYTYNPVVIFVDFKKKVILERVAA